MKVEEFLTIRSPPGKVLFAKLWGSRSHNTHKEDSDYDFSGVYLHPTSKVLSLNPPPSTWNHDSDEEDVDYQFFEVHKFCELLVKGNPAILEMLYTENYYVSTPEWDRLRNLRHLFLSCEVVRQYLGYMSGQLKKLIAHDGKGGLHTKGGSYNEKWAYHAMRLSEDAKRIASGKSPVVWKEGTERDFLMTVRNGGLSLEACKELIEKSIADVDALKEGESWPIPDEADRNVLNEWLLDIRKKNW